MAANDKNGLSREWTDVVLSPGEGTSFLLRPKQLLIAPGDVDKARAYLPDGWVLDDSGKTSGALRFRLPGGNGTAAEVLEAIAKVREGTRGTVRIAPNHVLVGEQTPVTFTGEPRIQGGNATCARPEARPKTLPLRTAQPADGKGVTIGVLDTGLFKHPWLAGPIVTRAGNAADTWDLDGDGFGDAEAGHGTFVSGLIRQVAPSAHIVDVKVLDSHGVGDDFFVAQAIEQQLPPAVTIVNLSLGGYTEDDSAPLAIAGALKRLRGKGGAVVAAAGNAGQPRPFWPAAFKQVVGVGAVQLLRKPPVWQRPDWSNYGYWVDAVARGVNVASTYALGFTTEYVAPPDPTVTKRTFDGWARWDGTSFSTPVVAAYLARLITRHGFATAQQAVDHLLSTAPPAPQPDYPLAVLVDDLDPGVPLP